ncbi:histidinol-phosphatase HisJ [Priestia megaterium]|nr:histidinol-phosphatase HisJ [Priestia megaterium]
MKVDRHIHTPFCPHGSQDSLQQYVEKAITLGFSEISFTEHAPLPSGFIDPTPKQDSGMNPGDLEHYLREVQAIKTEYKHNIKINIGLEVDFIDGFESETTCFLDQYGPYLDDSILSVHFLRKDGCYFCLDYSEDAFAHIVQKFGDVSKVYGKYYETLLKSIQADLGMYKPNRIGHMTLVHKFQKRFPCHDSFSTMIATILNEIKKYNLQLDYNGAGLFKPLCQETYPSPSIVEMARQKKIPLIYGSDAHCAKDVGQGYSQLRS